MPHEMKPIDGKRIEQCVKIIHPVLDSPRGVDQRGAIESDPRRSGAMARNAGGRAIIVSSHHVEEAPFP